MIFKNLVFDFDGVIAETNEIRFEGFRRLFIGYPSANVEELIAYSKINGGISRYVKIRFFFEGILGQKISDEEVNSLAARYSEIVKVQVVKAAPVRGSLEFFEKNHSNYNFAVISGSDEAELREVCKERGISRFFLEILGSPMNKIENFKKLFESTGWNRDETVFIGDSVNDYDAAKGAGVFFVGRKSGLESWEKYDVPVVDDIMQLQKALELKD